MILGSATLAGVCDPRDRVGSLQETAYISLVPIFIVGHPPHHRLSTRLLCVACVASRLQPVLSLNGLNEFSFRV
jgi:hypothetical protein